MALGLTEEHQALAEVAQRLLADHGGTGMARPLLDERREGLPSFWNALCALGWTGLHLPEASGGQGFGLAESAIVVEELGKVVAPGPFLATVVASAVIDRMASDEVRELLLPAIADGSAVAAFSLSDRVRLADGLADGEGVAV